MHTLFQVHRLIQKRACASFGIEFTDGVRRTFHDVVNRSDTNQYKNEVQLSAMNSAKSLNQRMKNRRINDLVSGC